MFKNSKICSPINGSKIVENLNKRILVTKKWLNPRPTFVSFIPYKQLFKLTIPSKYKHFQKFSVLRFYHKRSTIFTTFHDQLLRSRSGHRDLETRLPSPITPSSLVSHLLATRMGLRREDGGRRKKEREREREFDT